VSGRRTTLILTLLLIVIGAGWALTQPLNKIAVSTGYQPLGLVFWQALIGAVILGAICAATGRLFRPSRDQWIMALVIAMIGTVLPAVASYRAAVHLPAGVLSILLSLVPIISFPIAMAMATDHFSLRRFAGLTTGLVAVLLIALPEASLPDPAMVLWIPVALIAPAFYALEGNVVAKFGTYRMDAVQTLFLASCIGAVTALPAALAMGQFILPAHIGAPEAALIVSAAVHAAVYTGYVWLVGRAGPLFAVQVSYLVTVFGLVWSMLLLGERYAPQIWAALALMLVGMALVQPRPELKPRAALPEAGQDA
jgi:drug/metabolite transporter (DMT)-like permease